MPISSGASGSVVGKNYRSRSQSQAQSKHLSKFSSSTTSLFSSNSTSSSSLSNGIAIHRKKHSESEETEDLEQFMQVDPKIRSSVLKQKSEMQALILNATSTRGNICEYMVNQAAQFETQLVFARLLEQYMNKPRCYNMELNTAFLSHVQELLTHRNDDYVQLAFQFIDMVTNVFGDSIRHGLASQEYTIGVDVAAEQRFERCTKCKNALFQIRLNTAYTTERMSAAQRRKFEQEVIPRIDSIVAKTIKNSPGSDRTNQSSSN